MATNSLYTLLEDLQQPQLFPAEVSIRIEFNGEMPVMRASKSLQTRINQLLTKQQKSSLTRYEEVELGGYEQIDDFFSLVNRLIRNQMIRSEAPILE